jgi:hypothetical protein
MVPYLKGLHLTIDSWRSKRDPDGWRRTNAQMEAHLANKGEVAAEDVEGLGGSEPLNKRVDDAAQGIEKWIGRLHVGKSLPNYRRWYPGWNLTWHV